MTIREIARLAGVSTSTVSKIVNKKDINISSKTRERVLQIVKEYNYSPYSSVKNLSNTRTFTIALLLANNSCPSFIRGVSNEAAKNGYNILLLERNTSPEQELKNISYVCSAKVDGLIWEPVSADSYKHEHYLTEMNINFCYINAKTSKNIKSFYIDYKFLSYEMTQKLVTYKHTNIACLALGPSIVSNTMIDGFRECLFDKQIPYNPNAIFTDENFDQSNKIITHSYSGIICSDYAAFLALYEKLVSLHFSFPRDLSLICLKDDSYDNLVYPRITNLIVPHEQFGALVCQYLIRQCQKAPTKNITSLYVPQLTWSGNDSVGLPKSLNSKRITVIGSINTDTTFNVNTLPQAGKTTCIFNSTTTLGGKGANQAIAIARLGQEVSLIGEAGNDIESNLTFESLRQEHVDYNGVGRNSDAQTGKAYIYIDESGESTISVLAGANGRFSPDDIAKRQHLFEGSNYCLLSTEIPVETVGAALVIAKKNHAKTILKPATLNDLPQDWLEYIDYFIPNHKEAAALCPDFSYIEDQADYFYNFGIPNVIITMGHNGCYLKNGKHSIYYQAANFIPTDTTGGADAFIAALSVYLNNDYELTKAIQIATYAAGFCISRQGVIQALVDKITLETHVKGDSPSLFES